MLQVHVAAGAAVAAGTPLLVLEAMKMQHTLNAPAAGTVAALHVAPGDQIARGDLLVVIAPESG